MYCLKLDFEKSENFFSKLQKANHLKESSDQKGERKVKSSSLFIPCNSMRVSKLR